MVIEKLTLAGSLRDTFSLVYATSVQNGGSGWHLWQHIFGAPHSTAEFGERLARVQRGCQTLSNDVAQLELEDVTPGMKAEWIAAISRVRELVDPALLHENATNLRSRSSIQDVSALGTLHMCYVLQRKYSKIDRDELNELVTLSTELKERVLHTSLDLDTRNWIAHQIDDLLFYIENLQIYGPDALRNAAGGVAAAALRVKLEGGTDETDELSTSLGGLAYASGEDRGIGSLA